MIKIRYADLPAGLHARTEAHGRSTVIYLLPGLTAIERRAALVRACQSASLGYGPRLSSAGVAFAVARDRTRATLRNGVVAFRAHPLLLLPPLIIMAAATTVYLLTAAVTITLQTPPLASGLGSQLGGLPSAGQHGRTAQAADPGGGSSPAAHPASHRPGRSRSPHPPHSPSPSRTASLSPSPAPSTPTGSPLPSPSPSPSPPPSPSPSPSSSPPCLDIGPLGICLKL